MAEHDKSPSQALLDNDDQQQEHAPQMLNALQTALLNSKMENKELAEENAALKQQLLSNENSWEQEKKTLQEEMESCTSTLAWTRNSLENLGREFESAKAREAWYHGRQAEMEQFIHAKMHELHCCMAELNACRLNNNWLNQQVIEKDEKMKVMEDSFTKSLAQCNATWQDQRTANEDKAASELQALQKSCDEKIALIMKEKEDEITRAITGNTVLVKRNLECTLQLQDLNTELQQCETKFNALHQMTATMEEKAASELQALQRSCDEKVELIMKVKEEEITSAKTENMALVKKNVEFTLELQDLNTRLQQCETKFNALHQMTSSNEKKAAAELQALQRSCKVKVDLIMAEKDEKMTSAMNKIMTIIKTNVECALKLNNTNIKLQQCEADCEARVNALQERLEQEKKEKEELHKKRIEIEESWLNKERHWLLKVRRMEEDMQRLTTDNTGLQELASKTDKEKAKIKKEEEKRLKKEQKEQEKKEKEEREERKKNEKRERREREEQERREKEEREKNEKREKRERKEQDKREREEREQSKKREKRERKEQEKKEREEKERRKRMRENGVEE